MRAGYLDRLGHIFAQLKSQGLQIPVIREKKKLAVLQLITAHDLQNQSLIHLLSKWRKQNEHFFPTQFRVSDRNTKEWLDKLVLQKKDRLLFIIKEHKSKKIIGHLGLYRTRLNPLSIEIDNVVRGVSTGPDGLMTQSLLTLMEWAHTQFKFEAFFLQTFADNARSLSLYKRCGFSVVKTVPLVQKRSGTSVIWVSSLSAKKPRRFMYVMSLRYPKRHMNIALLANNIVGLEIARFLKSQNERIVLLGIHEKKRQKYSKEIVKVAQAKHIVSAQTLYSKKTIALLKSLDIDILIAAFWGYILKKEILEIPRFGCINFHPGYLPYNRGMNPNVWPFIEDTPSGVTIHYMDEGIDTGEIIAQKKIPISATDTAGTLEQKTWSEIVTLFKKNWNIIKNARIRVKKQNNTIATNHKARDIMRLDFIDPEKLYTGRELIQRLRARSYPSHTFAYTRINGKKVYLHLSLSRSSKRQG